MSQRSSRTTPKPLMEHIDDGIITMASSKASHCGSFHSAADEEEDVGTVGKSKASVHSAYYSTAEATEDAQSGLWSLQEGEEEQEGDDDRSVPFDEASTLPIAGVENNSVIYSIDNCSEDPNDRYSLGDVEEAIARAHRSKTASSALKSSSSSKHAVPRFIKSSSSRKGNRPSAATPNASSIALRSSQDQDSTTTSSSPVRPVPTISYNQIVNKSRNRCTAIFIALFLFVALAIIGLALVLYFFFLKESPSPSQAVTSTPDFPALSPSSDFSFFDDTPSPTQDVSIPSNPVVVTLTTPPTTAVTRPPTVSGEAALMQYLESNFSVTFQDDTFAPNNQAVAWLVEESAHMNTSLIIGGNKLLQRFALMTLDLNWRDQTNSSVVQQWVDECQWQGVVCDGYKVKELRWGSQGMSGTIPSEISLLSHLHYLDLSQNDLMGTIPETLFQLTNLERIYLYQNGLSGTLSTSIGNLVNLTHLHLSHNQLSGSIPHTMRTTFNVTRLYRYINLYSNSFSGPFPEGLGWQNVVYLDLGRNNFSGTLPQDLDTFVSLRHLHLDHNLFNGTIPDSLPTAGSDRLKQLSLDHNELDGEFPGEWAYSWHLTALTLHNNTLSSPVPTDVCAMSVMQGGGLVEMKADCEICSCGEPFCQECSIPL